MYNYKYFFISLWCLVIMGACTTNTTHKGVYNVLDYGAVNDSNALNTEVFKSVINQCAANGGGKVIVPPGKYLTGTILLKNHVELHLMKGATLYGSADSADYWYHVTDTFSYKRDGKSRQQPFGLIIADGVEDIAITGMGTIDGNGGKSEHYLAYPLTPDGSKWHKPPRPKIIMFYNSKRIKVHNIQTNNSNAWTQHYKRCDFLEIRGVEINAHANANGDGIDLDECRDVIISNCMLDTDDNAIILKSLGTRDTENITITNCIFASKITAIKTGTESGGGFQDITISNCIIRSSYEEEHFDKNRQQMNGSGIALEITDGGTMDGVVISDIVMEDCYAPFFIRLGNRGRKYGGVQPKPGTMKNIILDNIVCKNVRNNYTSTVAGFPGHYVEHLTMSNIRMECQGGIRDNVIDEMPENEKSHPWPGMYGRNVQYPAYGIWFRHVKNLKMINVQIMFKAKDIRPAVYFDDVIGADLVSCDLQAMGKPLVKVNTRDVTIK